VPSVLLVSDDPEFAQTLMDRWQGERSLPKFLLMSTPVWSEAMVGACDLAVIGPGESRELVPILQALHAGKRPILCVTRDSGAELRAACPRLMLLRDYEGWAEAVVMVAGEIMRRLEAAARCARLEKSLADAEVNATLGRYVLEMRHSLNNALTSLLGNSELMLLEPGALSADARDQLCTIHNMAMRIHEVLQRFTSMEREMKHSAGTPPSVRPAVTVPTPVITPVQESRLS
jgi:signal transduction histidine kinase